MKTETIHETRRLWETDPDKARARPTVNARADGSQAVIQAGPFAWRADLPATLGGTNEAPSPTLFLLGALAGCAVVFIRDTLAPQFAVRITDIQATVRCETDFRGLLGMGAVPADLENLRLDIEIASPDDEADVQQVCRAWQDRCPIYLALLKPTPVATTFRVTQG
jgi:uncharacterized OsmC-like protein